MKILIERIKKGQTALCFAAKNNRTDAAIELLGRGAKIGNSMKYTKKNEMSALINIYISIKETECYSFTLLLIL